MENIDELISKAKEIQSIDERTCYIMNYFLENVSYNYEYLFVRGYAIGTISGVSESCELDINKTQTDGDEEFSLTRSVIKGASRIFDDILQIRDKNIGDYSNFIAELRAYLTRELSSLLGNENLVCQSVETIIQKIEEGLREKIKFNFEGNEYYMNWDISKVLIDFFLEPKKYFPPKFNNGLITNGICSDYTNYLIPILQRAGIEAHSIKGTSEFGHSWIIVNSENGYKSVDLTRAVAIRDGFLGIPEEQTSQDWLYTDLRRMFEMQGTRTITKIDNIALPSPITPDNFDEQGFTDLMKQIIQGKMTDNTFKQILEQTLRDGVSGDECQRANAVEQNTIDREGQKR